MLRWWFLGQPVHLISDTSLVVTLQLGSEGRNWEIRISGNSKFIHDSHDLFTTVDCHGRVKLPKKWGGGTERIILYLVCSERHFKREFLESTYSELKQRWSLLVTLMKNSSNQSKTILRAS